MDSEGSGTSSGASSRAPSVGEALDSDVLLLEVTPLGAGLVADGWQGSRPLVVEACRGCGRWGHAGCAFLPASVPRRALALWWAGGWSPDSWDRLRRAWADAADDGPEWEAMEQVAVLFEPDQDETLALLHWAERAGLGRVILKQ